MRFRMAHKLSRDLVLALSIASMSCSAASLAYSSPSTNFTQLIELSAKRLEISRKVALTKWDTGQPVADPPQDPREQQVIAAAADEAGNRGLSKDLAASFFADQIEASKLVQYVMLADWRRSGQAPAEPRADLKAELRPALDRLRTQFIEELVANQAARESADCRKQLAAATADYGKSHQLDALYANALDRGLARVCGE